MPFRDIALLVLLCLIWAGNVLVSRIVVTDLGVPPLWYAALRTVVVMVALAPWLKWPGRDWWRVALVTTAVSGGGFALLFVGLQDATASSAAIVQLAGSWRRLSNSGDVRPPAVDPEEVAVDPRG